MKIPSVTGRNIYNKDYIKLVDNQVKKNFVEKFEKKKLNLSSLGIQPIEINLLGNKIHNVDSLELFKNILINKL